MPLGHTCRGGSSAQLYRRRRRGCDDRNNSPIFITYLEARRIPVRNIFANVAMATYLNKICFLLRYGLERFLCVHFRTRIRRDNNIQLYYTYAVRVAWKHLYDWCVSEKTTRVSCLRRFMQLVSFGIGWLVWKRAQECVSVVMRNAFFTVDIGEIRTKL